MITLTQRIILILHLALAFSLATWLLMAPYVEQTLYHKEKKLLLRNMQGDPTLTNKPHPQLLYAQHKFEQLPQEAKEKIATHWETVQASPFTYEYLQTVPYMTWIWLTLSLILPFALFFGSQGALMLSWTFPLLAYLAFASLPSPNPPLALKEAQGVSFSSLEEKTDYLLKHNFETDSKEEAVWRYQEQRFFSETKSDPLCLNSWAKLSLLLWHFSFLICFKPTDIGIKRPKEDTPPTLQNIQS